MITKQVIVIGYGQIIGAILLLLSAWWVQVEHPILAAINTFYSIFLLWKAVRKETLIGIPRS